MTLAERPTNRDTYVQHHAGVIRRSMENLLCHVLNLKPTELQGLSDVALGSVYVLTQQGMAETAKRIIMKPELIEDSGGSTFNKNNGTQSLREKMLIAANIVADAALTAPGSEHHLKAVSSLADLLAKNPQAFVELRRLQNNR